MNHRYGIWTNLIYRWYEYSYCKNSVYSMSLRLNMVELNHILGFHYQSTMSNNWPSRPGPVSQSELGKRIVGCLEVLILYVCLWGQPILILWKVDCLKIQHVSHCFPICSCYYMLLYHLPPPVFFGISAKMVLPPGRLLHDRRHVGCPREGNR